MKYRVVYPAKSCQKQIEEFLEDLPEGQRDQLMDVILSLGQNPRPAACVYLKPPPKILSFLASYRVRSGDFRIFYDINDEKKKVILFAIRRRNEATYKRR